MSNPYPAGGPAAAEPPGISLAKIGFILAVIPCTTGIGLILCIVAAVQSKNAGVPNPKAKHGIIASIIWTVVIIVAYAVLVAVGLSAGMQEGMTTS